MRPYVARLENWERAALRSWNATFAGCRTADVVALAELERTVLLSLRQVRSRLSDGARSAGLFLASSRPRPEVRLYALFAE